MLTLAEGQAGALVRVLFRLRFFVLLFALAALMAAAPLPVLRFVQTGEIFPAAATLVFALCVAFAYLRHTGLAFLVAASPVCGLAWANAANVFLQRPETGILGYIIGTVAGLLIADALSSTVATGVHRSDAARAAFAAYIPPLLASMLFAVAPAIPLLIRDGLLPALSASLCLALPVLAALLIVPLAGSYFRYDENYLELASRLYERRQRVGEMLSVLAEPRWSLSLSGILIVFIVLFSSGAPDLDLTSLSPLLAIDIFLLCAAAFVATRRWRAATAVISATIVSLLAGLATAGRLSLPIWAVTDMLIQPATIAFLLAAAVAWRFTLGERDGDDPEAARMRGFARLSSPLLCCAGLSLITILFWYGRANILLLFAILLAGQVAALVAVPALTGALETTLARRRSLENLYRG